MNQQRQAGGQGTTNDQLDGAPGPPPRLGGPHVVHFTPWKEVAEIEAGRLEFFKQTLTLALAGIGGLAAIVVDSDKVPGDWGSEVLLIIFAVSAILLVIVSSDGISTYANYLRAVRRASENPTDDLRNKQERSEKSILNHARGAIVLSWIAALALIIFAIMRIVQPSSTGAETAMRMAKEILSKQPGNPVPKSLVHFRTAGDNYLITYITDPNQVPYTVRINRRSTSVSEIVPEPNP